MSPHCNQLSSRPPPRLPRGDPPRGDRPHGKRTGRSHDRRQAARPACRAATGEDPHIVFEYVGRATFGVSVFVVRRGGTVVTCGSSRGYQPEFDNRYLWTRLERVIGSHGANLQEQSAVHRLLGHLAPALTATYPPADTAEAARLVQNNAHMGKVGVLSLAPGPGLGITEAEPGVRLLAAAP
ncbi:zinc-binding dehydrogenase [Streptomyces sp. NBC_01236]|uniref:zinc-binding dehydrogenase n=1 Tax=Streptomyces sp. NBC_01236 TaxID=2903789 RepID=UPI002E0E10ED